MQKKLLIYFCLLMSLLAFQNCGGSRGSTGTETGNPIRPTPNGPTVGVLVNSLCVKVNGCDPNISISSCASVLISAEGSAQSFGVPSASGISTLLQLMDAEEKGLIVADGAKWTACRSQIDGLVCSDTRLISLIQSQLAANAFSSLIMSLNYCPNVY